MQKKVKVLSRKELFDEPILAQIKIDKDADFLPATSFVEAGEEVNIRERYVLCRSIPGGYFKIFLYGAKADDLGKRFTAELTFWKRITDGNRHNKIYYANAEIRRNKKTNVRLAIRDNIEQMMAGLPVIKMTFNGNHPSFIGFTEKRR